MDKAVRRTLADHGLPLGTAGEAEFRIQVEVRFAARADPLIPPSSRRKLHQAMLIIQVQRGVGKATRREYSSRVSLAPGLPEADSELLAWVPITVRDGIVAVLIDDFGFVSF